MELFVIGHEYGHCIAGHLDGAQRHSLPVKTLTDEEIEEIATNWQQESEADFYGCVLTIETLLRRKMDLALSFIGIATFFGAVHLLENFVSVLCSGEAIEHLSATHPPPLVRLENLKRNMTAMIRDGASLGMNKLSESIWAVIDAFWEQISPFAVKLHKDGIRPRMQWTN